MDFHYGYNYDDMYPDFVPEAVDYVVGTAPAGEDPEQYDDIAAFHAGFLAGTVTNSGPADNLTALNKETVGDGVVEQAEIYQDDVDNILRNLSNEVKDRINKRMADIYEKERFEFHEDTSVSSYPKFEIIKEYPDVLKSALVELNDNDELRKEFFDFAESAMCRDPAHTEDNCTHNERSGAVLVPVNKDSDLPGKLVSFAPAIGDTPFSTSYPLDPTGNLYRRLPYVKSGIMINVAELDSLPPDDNYAPLYFHIHPRTTAHLSETDEGAHEKIPFDEIIIGLDLIDDIASKRLMFYDSKTKSCIEFYRK